MSESNVKVWPLCLGLGVALTFSLGAQSQESAESTTEQIESTRSEMQSIQAENNVLKAQEESLLRQIDDFEQAEEAKDLELIELQDQLNELMRSVEENQSEQPSEDPDQPVAIETPPSPPFTVLQRTPPVYPKQAADQQLEGHVEFSFTLTANDRITDIQILESVPNGTFDQASLAAIQSWAIDNHTQSDLQISDRLEFKLNL